MKACTLSGAPGDRQGGLDVSDIQKNKDICRQFYRHVCARQFPEAMALIAPDAEWWIQGSLPVSGMHSGKQAVVELFRTLEGGLAEDFRMDIKTITAEEDRVGLEIAGDAMLKDGQHYRNTYHILMWIENGLIKKCNEYVDTLYTYGIFFGSPENATKQSSSASS
jgi:ketosteroid isomerase-like protein